MSKFHEALELAKRKKQAKSESRQESKTVFLSERIKTVFGRDLVVFNRPESEMAEYFRFLRTAVTRRPGVGESPRAIMVTSALTGEGKTFVSGNLAAAISQSLEEHVLLIDADLRNPRQHKIFGIGSNDPGLSAYLAKNLPLSDLLVKTAMDKLTILRGGNSTKTPAELLSSEKMRGLIEKVKELHPDHYVILDSSPLEITPESSALARIVDGVLLVVRCGRTPRNVVRSALEKIPREKLMGIVFNGSRVKISEMYEPYGNVGTGM